MQRRGAGLWFMSRILFLAVVIVVVASGLAATKEKVLYTFPGGHFGGHSYAGLISDAQGNLYGTTAGDCDSVTGSCVFKLVHNKNGSWTEVTLYRFNGNSDGDGPQGSLVFDKKGNLYGTTTVGGTHPPISDGTVFKLTPTKSGEWKETIIHSFNCTEGHNTSGRYHGGAAWCLS